jgi:hypothetical protein
MPARNVRQLWAVQVERACSRPNERAATADRKRKIGWFKRSDQRTEEHLGGPLLPLPRQRWRQCWVRSAGLAAIWQSLWTHACGAVGRDASKTEGLLLGDPCYMTRGGVRCVVW